jgi:glycosyltransferase involved in cell wall biosynthesis
LKKRHVVMLVENLPFERDRRVKQEARSLADAGYELTVICPRIALKDEFAQRDWIRVYSYPQPWQGTGWVSYVLEYLWALGWTALLLVWTWIRHGLDVVHAANPPDLFFLIAAPLRLFGIAFVFDQHDLGPELFQAKFRSQPVIERIVLYSEICSYRLASRVIVTNQSAYEIAIGRGKIQPSKVTIVRNGPDLSRFCTGPPQPYLKKGATYLAVYAGAVEKQDGVDRIVEAASYLVHTRNRTDIHFALLGDGSDLERVSERIKAFKLEGFFSLRGWVGDQELLSYLSTADVCLAPDPPVQFNQSSTFIKIMEYMSCGKVTVCFDLLESRRTAGDTAVFVGSDDTAEFARAIEQILDDGRRRYEMGNAARGRSLGLHWGISKEALIETYEKLFFAKST